MVSQMHQPISTDSFHIVLIYFRGYHPLSNSRNRSALLVLQHCPHISEDTSNLSSILEDINDLCNFLAHLPNRVRPKFHRGLEFHHLVAGDYFDFHNQYFD